MEVSLYNVDGKACMYISDDNETIYSWDGYAVCYLDGENIYGWRGKHLGWFVGGIVYDLDGYRIGFTQDASSDILFTERTKWTKKTQWTKSTKHSEKMRPNFKTSNRGTNLLEYLSQDSPS